MIKHCLICKKEIKIPKCLIKRKKYCSKKCLYLSTKERMKGNILWKKTIKTQFKKGHKYLGTEGEQHQSWKYGAPNSKAWLRWAKTVKKRDKYICSHCNYKGHSKSKNIVAHHVIHYKLMPKLKFKITNGITLCRKCHPLFHPELINNLK